MVKKTLKEWYAGIPGDKKNEILARLYEALRWKPDYNSYHRLYPRIIGERKISPLEREAIAQVAKENGVELEFEPETETELA